MGQKIMVFDGRVASIAQEFKSRNPKIGKVFRILNANSGRDLVSLLHALSSSSVPSPHIFGCPFPQSVGDLAKTWDSVFDGGFEWNIQRIAAEVRIFRREVQQFLEYQTQFTYCLLTGQRDAAEALLDTIEEKLGTSIWLIESRLSLMQLYHGVERQKRFAHTILDHPKISSIIKTIAFYLSQKAEEAVTTNSYLAGINITFPLGKDLFNGYYHFHLVPFAASGLDDLNTILVIERCASLIDRYQTLIRVAQIVASNNKHSLLRPAVAAAIKLVESKVVDARIENLCIALSIPREREPSYFACADEDGRSFLQLVDLYTAGAYQRVSEAILPSGRAESVARIELIARSRARIMDSINAHVAPHGDLISRLIASCVSILVKRKGCLDELEAFRKTLFMFSCLPWAAELNGIIYRESDAKNFSGDDINQALSQLNGSPYSPRLVLRYKSRRPAIQSAKVEFAVTSTLTYKFLKNIKERPSDVLEALKDTVIPRSRLIKYRAFSNFRINDFQGAYTDLSELYRTGDFLDRQEALVGMIYVLLRDGKTADGMKLTAEALVAQPELHTKICLSEVLYCLENSSELEKRCAHASIYPSICYSLASRLTGINLEGKLSIVCEEFLLRNSTVRPSQLLQAPSGIDQSILIYFLHFVCTTDVLDSHVEYESTQDVEDERILVLQGLIELDPENRSIYAEEIAQITRRQMILKGVRVIETSKIYVDVDGVKNALGKDARDLFVRYRSLPVAYRDLTDLILEVKRVLDKTNNKLKVVLPVNERAATLYQLFTLVRDRFVSSNEYGLDVYLSTGIRHGTLSGQLRSVFENERLITQRDASGTYSRNEYWCEQLEALNVSYSQISMVDAYLADFSKAVDDIIGFLKHDWIQISTEDKPSKGLFDFSLLRTDAIRLDSQMPSDITFEEAIEIILNALWQRTDQCLSNVRDKLDGEFKSLFFDAIDHCISAIDRIGDRDSLAKLRSALVAARTRLQEEVAYIAAWFTRQASDIHQPYTVAFATDVALEMVKRCYPRRELLLSKEINSERRLPGHTLRGIVEIFFIAFDNILRHCGSSSQNPEASLTSNVDDNSLQLSLSSQMFVEVDVDKENLRLGEYMKEARRSTASDRVRREGGSGLIKIAKIVKVDFGGSMSMDFSYTSKNSYLLKLSVTGGRLFE